MQGGLSTILVATDFSDNAHRALQWAIALATASNPRSKIILIYAIEPSSLPIDALESAAADHARASLTAAQQEASNAGVTVTAEHHLGKSWTIIANAARKHNADLIVIGTRGRTGYKRILLGSTADRLIRTSPVPVLVIHPNDSPPAGGVNSILVPIDFSEESSIATSMAVKMFASGKAQSGRRTLHLLHAIELTIEWPGPAEAGMPRHLTDPRYWQDAERNATQRLESIAGSLRRDDLDVKVHVVRDYPPNAIESFCGGRGSDKVDMVSMGTQGRGAIDRFLIGSVAERVLHHVGCPVLVTHRPSPTDPVRVAVE